LGNFADLARFVSSKPVKLKVFKILRLKKHSKAAFKKRSGPKKLDALPLSKEARSQSGSNIK
jgi:hypothetical protein